MNIKKIIREEIDSSLNWMGDIEPMSPQMMWLKDNFGKLVEMTPDEDNRVHYVDSEGVPLFYYYQDEENGYVHISYWRIWSKLKDDFGLNYSEIQELITEWLSQEPYNLRGFTPTDNKHLT